MREFCTSGSVGAPGERSPGATRRVARKVVLSGLHEMGTPDGRGVLRAMVAGKGEIPTKTPVGLQTLSRTARFSVAGVEGANEGRRLGGQVAQDDRARRRGSVARSICFFQSLRLTRSRTEARKGLAGGAVGTSEAEMSAATAVSSSGVARSAREACRAAFSRLVRRLEWSFRTSLAIWDLRTRSSVAARYLLSATSCCRTVHPLSLGKLSEPAPQECEIQGRNPELPQQERPSAVYEGPHSGGQIRSADRHLLRRIIRNSLDNSARYRRREPSRRTRARFRPDGYGDPRQRLDHHCQLQLRPRSPVPHRTQARTMSRIHVRELAAHDD